MTKPSTSVETNDGIGPVDPINPVVKSPPPSCVRRNLLRLTGDVTSTEFVNKFNLLFHSWLNDREVILGGTGTCTAEGDELIKVVMPK